MRRSQDFRTTIAGRAIRFSWDYCRVRKLRQYDYPYRGEVETVVDMESEHRCRYSHTFAGIPNLLRNDLAALLWAETDDGRHELVGYLNIPDAKFYVREYNVRKLLGLERCNPADRFQTGFAAILGGFMAELLALWGVSAAGTVSTPLMAAIAALPLGLSWLLHWAYLRHDARGVEQALEPFRELSRRIFEVCQVLFTHALRDGGPCTAAIRKDLAQHMRALTQRRPDVETGASLVAA